MTIDWKGIPSKTGVNRTSGWIAVLGGQIPAVINLLGLLGTAPFLTGIFGLIGVIGGLVGFPFYRIYRLAAPWNAKRKPALYSINAGVIAAVLFCLFWLCMRFCRVRAWGHTEVFFPLMLSPDASAQVRELGGRHLFLMTVGSGGAQRMLESQMVEIIGTFIVLGLLFFFAASSFQAAICFIADVGDLTKPAPNETKIPRLLRQQQPTAKPEKPTMPEDSKAHIFVSHSSKDKPFARKLVEALRGHNLNVWIDERELQVGDSIVAGVSEGLKDVGYLVAVLSKASMASRWVQAELNTALMEELSGKGVAVLPVLIEDCDLPPLLKDRVYADFRDDFQAGFQKLLAVFEQEGESTEDVAPNAATAAAPCSKKLSTITLADLRRRISKRMDRGEVAGLWFAVLETQMEDDMMGRQLSECVITLLVKAKNRNKLHLIIEEICQDRPELADP